VVLALFSFFEPINPGTYVIVLSVDFLKGEVPRANSFFCIKASLDVSPEFSQALIQFIIESIPEKLRSLDGCLNLITFPDLNLRNLAQGGLNLRRLALTPINPLMTMYAITYHWNAGSVIKDRLVSISQPPMPKGFYAGLNYRLSKRCAVQFFSPS